MVAGDWLRGNHGVLVYVSKAVWYSMRARRQAALRPQRHNVRLWRVYPVRPFPPGGRRTLAGAAVAN